MNKNSRVYIAGHSGFVGGALTEKLKAKGFRNLILISHEELDLTNQERVDRLFSRVNPEYVFLLAAKVGGIYANNTKPADFIYQNIAIQTNVIHAAYKYKAKKLLFLGSSCMYPKHCLQPIKEEYLLTSEIEPTNEPFAVAKIAGVKMCQAYNRQYKTDFITAVPATVYGPGDDFTISGHVVGSLIGKFFRGDMRVWGTGRVKRELIFIDDLVDALIFLMQNYSGSGLINIGTGQEISIKDLAGKIKKNLLRKEKIHFEKRKPDGMPSRFLDSSKISSIGWKPKVSLEEGIKLTCEWFKRKRPIK